MRFFDLVEKNHSVRLTANGLGELATFIKSHISRRSADETLNAKLFHVFAHIDTNECLFAIKEKRCQGLCKLGFADTCGTQEEEASQGSTRIGKTCSAPSYAGRHRRDCFILADHTCVQARLKMFELGELAFQHFCNWNMRPRRDNLSDFFRRNLLLEQAFFLLTLSKSRLLRAKLFLKLGQKRIANFARAGKISLLCDAVHLLLCSIYLRF